MGKHVDFWEVLLQKLSAQRKSESWLAKKLGVPVQTFASWKQRGQFRWDCLQGLDDHVRWKLDVEKALLLGVNLIQSRDRVASNDFHPTENILRRINADYRLVEKSLIRYRRNTQLVLDTLAGNCFFAFSACTTSPYEFEATEDGDALALTITRAISRGVLCLYVRPTEHAISYYKDTWSFGELVHFDDSQREFNTFRERARKWLLKGENGVKQAETADEAEEWLHERLQQCYIDRSPMWMPGFGLSMAGWNFKRELKTRMTISLPGARFGGVLVYPSYLLLEYRFGRFLRKAVTDACTEIGSLKRGATLGQIFLEIPEGAKYLDHASRFYDRYSQLLRSVNSYEPPSGALSDPHGPDFSSL